MLMRTVALVGIAVAVIACGTVPVYNVNEAPVPATKKVEATQVRSAILAAGQGLGWQMSEVRPGLIRGTISLRSHSAEVEVPYTTTKYSIVLKSSSNLNESGGNIHKNYNGWIQNLERTINANLRNL